MVKMLKLTVSSIALLALGACGGGGGGNSASNPTLSSITVTPNPATSTVNQPVPFTATGHYSDNSTQSSLPVIWNSSNPSFTISPTGVASSAWTGSTTITATSTTNSSVSGTATLTVQ